MMNILEVYKDMMAVWLWLNICNNELKEEVMANMVLDEDIHNLHCKNIEIHTRQQSGKYVQCRFVPKKKSRKTLVCGMKKMSSKNISKVHCYFYTLLITQFLSHFNPLCTSKKNLSPFVLWIFKKTYSLFLLNNTLIPS